MNKRQLFYVCCSLLIVALMFDPAYCGISDAQIKAASKEFVSKMGDWIPMIIGGGLVGSGVCLFTSNFKMGLAGLAGTTFLYMGKAFTGTGEGAMIHMAEQVLRLMS